jgi:hypothetical protein
VGGFLSFALERYRDRRSASAAAVFVHHSLGEISAALRAAQKIPSATGLYGRRRFLSVWNEQCAALARYISPDDWTTVAKAFSFFDGLTYFDPHVLDSETTLSPQEIAFIRPAIDRIDNARSTLERIFSLEEGPFGREFIEYIESSSPQVSPEP